MGWTVCGQAEKSMRTYIKNISEHTFIKIQERNKNSHSIFVSQMTVKHKIDGELFHPSVDGSWSDAVLFGNFFYSKWRILFIINHIEDEGNRVLTVRDYKLTWKNRVIMSAVFTVKDRDTGSTFNDVIITESNIVPSVRQNVFEIWRITYFSVVWMEWGFLVMVETVSFKCLKFLMRERTEKINCIGIKNILD